MSVFLFADVVLGRGNMDRLDYRGTNSPSRLFDPDETGTFEHGVSQFAEAGVFHVADGPDYVEVTGVQIEVFESGGSGNAGVFTAPVS